MAVVGQKISFMKLLWVSACTLLVCVGAGSEVREFLRVGNFRELRSGFADGPLDGNFPFGKGGSAVPKGS